jgi:hypothetical protein
LIQVSLTICRSAASGALDVHFTLIFAPLVGCSGLLARVMFNSIRGLAPFRGQHREAASGEREPKS